MPNATVSARLTAVAALPAAGVIVSVYFHVLRSGPAVDQGNIPDSTVAAQIQVKTCQHLDRTALLSRQVVRVQLNR